MRFAWGFAPAQRPRGALAPLAVEHEFKPASTHPTKKPPCGGLFIGAGDEIRTHDPNLGKVVLYP